MYTIATRVYQCLKPEGFNKYHQARLTKVGCPCAWAACTEQHAPVGLSTLVNAVIVYRRAAPRGGMCHYPLVTTLAAPLVDRCNGYIGYIHTNTY